MIEITNEIVKISIPKRDLDSYLKIGWKLVKRKKSNSDKEMPKNKNGNKEIKGSTKQK